MFIDIDIHGEYYRIELIDGIVASAEYPYQFLIGWTERQVKEYCSEKGYSYVTGQD